MRGLGSFSLPLHNCQVRVNICFAVGDITPRTQWLLHYSFTKMKHSNLGVKMTGAERVNEKGKNNFNPMLCLPDSRFWFYQFQ